jgi:hypothetical protein
MKNAETIRKRLDEIKEMDDWHKALSSLADIQYEIGMDACSERHELQKEIENLRRVIIGNGDPSNSLVARLSDVEKCMGEIGNDIKEIKTALVGDMDNDSPGIKGRVRDCEKFADMGKKIIWAVVLTTLAQVVATILGLL